MSRRDRMIGYWGLRLTHIIILITTFIVMIFILISASSVFITSFKATDRPIVQKVKTEYVILSADSLVKDASQYKALTTKIDEVEKSNSEALSDLRQESNNIINKVNGWLGFWIAILAIFCGVIPMVVQYILRQQSKREIEEIFEQLNVKVENSRLQLLVSCISTVNSYRIIRDSRLKTEFLKTFTQNAYLALSEIIEEIFLEERSFSREKEITLLGALVQFSRILDILLEEAQMRARSTRELWILRSRLNNIIESILDHENNTRQNVWDRLLDLLPYLQNLPISS